MISKHPFTGISVALLALFGLLMVIGCTPSHPMSTFDPRGPVAERQMTLFYVIFWASVLVFVVVGGGLLYTVIRFRRRPGQGIPVQVHGNKRLEIGWTIAPTLVLAVVAVPTLAAQFYVFNAPKGSLEVNVTAHQWWWEIEYPDSGVVTANELHVPIDKPVKVNLTSKDVVHSFWVPKLAGKIDMFPGKTTNMWFKAAEVGEYFGQCAEFCGQSHARMRFRVFVDSPEEFEAWKKSQLAEAALPASPEETKGAKLFLSKGCIACHTVSGVPGAVGIRGPNLTHLGGRSTMAAGIMDMNADNLREWLTDPNDFKSGNIMSKEAPVYTNPNLALSGGDIDGLVAYLQSLR